MCRDFSYPAHSCIITEKNYTSKKKDKLRNAYVGGGERRKGLRQYRRFATNLSAVAQKSNQNQPGQESGRAPEESPQVGEFENAVTTEISDVLATAFGENSATEPNDVYVTDMQLASHVDPDADDVLGPGFILKDRFEIVELVHSGGMSLVYKAVDQRRRPEGSGEIHVAIKMMRPSIASDEKARLSLEREAAKAQSLSHPNIINIFDFDDHEGRFFLVMEWLEGESVNAMLRRTSGKRLDPDFAWALIEGAAAGVQHAHQKNVVHADINPSNIFITEDREIKLLDFGVARYESNSDVLEDDRLNWVTKPYASPEVLSGLTPVFEDDVFSLACIAYRLLGGKHPFGGRLSLVAKHQNRLVEPIAGLPENEWRMLQRSLAYDRSGRPGSVEEFLARSAGAVGDDKPAGRLSGRGAGLAVAALVIVVGGLWLLQRGGDIETVEEEAMAPATVDTPAITVPEALVVVATQALEEGRLVSPDGRSARALFREVLVLEPGNAEAQRGLRTISNDFVQQAQVALNANDPAQAYAALAVATETDPANPAIEIVNQLLAARANGELADARLAVATGSYDLAAERLAEAEQYRSIDPAEVQLILQQIEQGRQREQFLASLAAADAYIASGQLLSPEGDNAQALLLELYGQSGDDPRLLASMERLGERLLARAAFAAADARFAEASELLDAVEALGVLTPEVEAARLSLEAPAAPAESEDVASPEIAEEQPAELSVETPADEPAILAEEGLPSPQVAEEQAVELPVEASAEEPAALAEPEPEPETITADAESEARRQSLQELGIRKYVAPKFPRFATLRGVSGSVEVGFTINADGSTSSIEVLQSEPDDVFVKSATNAVRRWRFETREQPLQAQVTLRFDHVR